MTYKVIIDFKAAYLKRVVRGRQRRLNLPACPLQAGSASFASAFLRVLFFLFSL
jgi:hypothetical protein